MKRLLLFSVATLAGIFSSAQTFTDATSDAPSTTYSGGCVAVTDMNGDGFDDVLTLDNGTDITVFYQNLDGVEGFTVKTFGSISNESQWGMAVGDLNNDGHKDVFSGGSYDGVHHCAISDPDTHVLTELGELMFMQCANLADINNDGWLDAFGCHDDAESNIFGNDGAGNISNQDWINMETTPASDNSGNYGSVWSDIDNDNDLDLVIAKCRQFVNDPQDPRRINAAFMNDGDNNYTDEALERGLVLYEQSWTVDFADIDNDGDFDALFTNHSTTLTLMENDGCGNFTDITEGSGLEIPGFFLQAKLSDFDNDGFVDLIYSGGLHAYHKNNGDGTFTEISGLFPANDTMHSFGIGDLNNDGWLDVFASYGDTYVNSDYNNPDKIWLNDGGDNNWIGFDLEGVESNKDAVGAKIQIYGDFGTQVREVRAGESYGITNSNKVHFGIGAATEVDYAVIKWPSGKVSVIENGAAGVYHSIEENACDVAQPQVSAESDVVCGEATTMVSVDAEGLALWSDGSIGTSVEVGSGNHSAVVVDGNGCAALSNTVCVLFVSELDAEIEALGQIEFCEGESVVLEAPDNAPSYMWSNNETGSSIEVTESGSYSVVMEGLCTDELVSNTIDVQVFDAPTSEPTSQDVDASAGMIELTATGENLVWFSDENAQLEIGTGSPFILEATESTTVYVANEVIYGDLEEATGGKENISTDTGQHHNNSGNGLRFTANEDMIIKNVKVDANGEDERTITVYSPSFEVIASETFNIPDGESVVPLNYFIPQGEDYIIITDDNNPQLWRDAAGSGVNYPYNLGDLGAITGTTIEGANEFTYYYFFYDWNVETAAVSCLSDLVPVNITITGIDELESITSFKLFPNPASTELRYEFSALKAGNLMVSLYDATGKEVYNNYLDIQNGSHQGVIDLSEMAPGIYTFTLVEAGKIATQKIVIE